VGAGIPAELAAILGLRRVEAAVALAVGGSPAGAGAGCQQEKDEQSQGSRSHDHNSITVTRSRSYGGDTPLSTARFPGAGQRLDGMRTCRLAAPCGLVVDAPPVAPMFPTATCFDMIGMF